MPTLTWLDREAAVKVAEAVPFRVLDFDPALSAGDPAAQRCRPIRALQQWRHFAWETP
jgi:hypothetical protein